MAKELIFNGSSVTVVDTEHFIRSTSLADVDSELESEIDHAAGMARSLAGSNGVYQFAEYHRVGNLAQAFEDSGYAEPAPTCVVSHAREYGVSNQQACMDILLISELWNNYLDAVRDIRLKKQRVFAATTESEKRLQAKLIIEELEALNVP